MDKVHIIGAGVMGSGLAQFLAGRGRPVVLLDVDAGALERSRARIRDLTRLARFLGGQEGATVPELLGRIVFGTALDLLHDASWLLENVTEDLAIKARVYRECDRICPAECIFISNTSALPITELGAMSGRPDRVIGVHFMNPVALIPTVELIPGRETSVETVARTREFLTALDKQPVTVRDGAGFVSNRLLMGMINEAARLVEEGVAAPEDIDRICRECFGHRMGPLETADLIGLDTIRRTLEVLQRYVSGERYATSPGLSAAVDRGDLGRKSGRGFHDYGMD
ncbi:MAG: 3-hydroxyacyl-CoA dehydrogenase family protein [Candidatus Eisenbacteria bacterium]